MDLQCNPITWRLFGTFEKPTAAMSPDSKGKAYLGTPALDVRLENCAIPGLVRVLAQSLTRLDPRRVPFLLVITKCWD